MYPHRRFRRLSPLPRAFAAAVVVVGVLGASAVPASASHGPGRLFPACEAGHVPPSSFSDIDGNAHELAVECLNWYGVVNGANAQQYVPAAPVRRDQMASFLARTLTVLRVDLPPAGDRFSDIDGNVHEDNIERLAAAGVVYGVAGCSQQQDSASRCSYDPAGLVTRAQTATLLVRAYAIVTDRRPVSCQVRDYFDDDDGNAHEANINEAVWLGLATGTTKWMEQDCEVFQRGKYSPNAPVRRDQMATFLGRLLAEGVLWGPGATARPYPRGTQVLLKDGWLMELVGSDNDATAEVLAADPDNEGPAQDHRYVVVRVRATYTGEGTSTFDGGGRLAARALGAAGFTEDGQYLGIFPSQGRPCGDIPDELQNPSVGNGGTVEGNVCFEVSNFGADQPNVIDRRWGTATVPHLSRYAGDDRTEVSPYNG